MSFRDVAFGKENCRVAPVGRERRLRIPAGKNKKSQRNEKGRRGDPSPPTGGLLYNQLRLVPSSSCESSTQSYSDDHQPTSLNESMSSYSASQSMTSMESFSLNPHEAPHRSSSNPQSGNVVATRGVPGFSTNRTRRNSAINAKQQASIRGWTKGVLGKEPPQRAEVLHSTGLAEAPAEASTKVSVKAPSKDSAKGSSKRVWTSPSPPQLKTKGNPQQARDTEFSKLSTEIKHFQRMVAELQTSLEASSGSPENQWKSRILVRSAQEADGDIADKLYLYEMELVEQGRSRGGARTAQAACMKLHRDYHSAHEALDAILLEQASNQQPDVAHGAVNNAGDDAAMLVQQEQEDFFERATRERNEEIKRISRQMQQVNDIYQELANLVDGQQEHIDVVEENMQAAKSSVDKGLKHIEYARDKLCVMGDEGYEAPQCGGMDDIEVRPMGGSSSRSSHPSSRKGGEGSN